MGTPGRISALNLRVRSAALYTFSYGSMKWCPWQDSHPHWTASEAVVSALDYKGMKMVALDGLAPSTLRFKGACSHFELQGCFEIVGPAGFEPARFRL